MHINKGPGGEQLLLRSKLLIEPNQDVFDQDMSIIVMNLTIGQSLFI